MKRSKISLALATGVTLLVAAAAQPAFAGESKTKPIMGIPSSAVADFGGAYGVHNWVESLFYYIMLDNRINYIFKEFGNVDRQIALNTQLEQMVLGGPNNYQGASMSAAHADLGITMTQFNAVVEAAYNACERNEIKYYACNDLIAALAPFTRVIVTK
ncbi:group I truncated hemoglobin [Solimonas terrae]|uniref:Group 1 truncated hemoglobin n=1 Tax=Solimonas terrae TaxID=1396819 RepID=A0A6M2BMT3_9GAMM|nr:group 1 truncated hemoglobin [Solimonas terrae]NGY03409.1 group 1 truncated hemoglobin [Solimonas terrae]